MRLIIWRSAMESVCVLGTWYVISHMCTLRRSAGGGQGWGPTGSLVR